MKTKRILSFVMASLMTLTCFFAILPMKASAAYSESTVSTTVLPKDTVKKIVEAAYKYEYETAEEMLAFELSEGYLDSVAYRDADGSLLYTLYVNRYTGVIYYKNEKTGQILTSNPTDIGAVTKGKTDENKTAMQLYSQLIISYSEIATSTSREYNSTRDAAVRAQVSVNAIKNGLRVNYILGNTASRYLLPGMLKAEAFEEKILVPMIEKYEELLESYCREAYPDADFTFLDGYTLKSGKELEIRTNGYIDTEAALQDYLMDTQRYFKNVPNGKVVQSLNTSLRAFVIKYALQNPQVYVDQLNDDNPKNDKIAQTMLDDMYKRYPITKDGIAVYVFDNTVTSGNRANFAKTISTYCPSYSFSDMYADERDVGYVAEVEQNAIFRVALEYSFADDGSLLVRLPANSITYDSTLYHVTSISSLPYFGAGDMNGKDGYIFYPDGSGAIVDFADFYNSTKKTALSLSSSIYGQDFAYSKISGQHREQITLPVFGLVGETKRGASTVTSTGSDTVKNGFFAVVEDGMSLANLSFRSGGSEHKYASVFPEFMPYPADEYDLSKTISVGAKGTYTMVAKTQYTGSYVTRYKMLADDSVIAARKTAGDTATYYPATYVGMAAYYRNLLRESGVLSALTTDTKDIPLYVESFGAMQIQDKFLSFPITKTIALTSFNDVIAMYGAFSAAGIKNVNFKLTGFMNGGMEYTYPVKIRWERAVGGEDGFKNLIKQANTVSESADAHFGVYPDFDFQYISETGLFDGVSLGRHVSRMVDNRYASKQIYNAIVGEFESFFNMVVTADALDSLYTTFAKRYAKYDTKRLSVSTLGSDLNSDFNEDRLLNREEARDRVISVLTRMKDEGGYEIMTSVGNSYALKYAKHLTGVATDSSHFRYSSYAVPFLGMILHGSISYTGTPLNYSGSPEYDLLRAVESGAYPSYILCYENTAYLKEDENLNKYYGVDYTTWFDSVKSTYSMLNEKLADLQTFFITDHRTLIAERIIDKKEQEENLATLENEAIERLDRQIAEAIDRAFDEMRADPANAGRGIRLSIDRAASLSVMATQLGLAEASALSETFVSRADAVIAKYTEKYGNYSENPYDLAFALSAYTSDYKYLTDSSSDESADTYEFTDYTCDNNNVILVTYSDGTKTVSFLLNYNVYPVNVRLNGTVHTLAKYGFERIG